MDEAAPDPETSPVSRLPDSELESLRRDVERLRLLASDDKGVLDAILEHSPHGIILSDASGRLVLQNRAAERIWAGSATADTVEAWGVYRGFHPDGTPFQGRDWALATCLETRLPVEARAVHIRRFDGTEGHLVASSAPLFSAEGELQGAISVFADVTALHASEAQSRRLETDLAAKIRDLESFAARAGVLQKVTAALTRTETFAEVAEVITTSGRELFGATGSLFYLCDRDRLVLIKAAGISDQRTGAWRDLPLDQRDALPDAVRAAEPMWLTTRAELLAAYPHLARVELDGRRLEGLVALPLSYAGQVIGGLAFSFYGPFLFDAVQRDFFLTMADQCAQVIQRTRASDAEREVHRKLRREQERLEVLARAGESLSSTLGSEAAMSAFARIVVPAIADWCTIDELLPDGRLRRLALAHRDPAKVAFAQELALRYPPDPGAAHGAYGVSRSGKTEWVLEIGEELLRASARDPRHLEILLALRLTSYATVPLLWRGRVVGVLSLVCEGERRLLPEDLQLVEDLARRAAMALENGRLYESARAHAETLGTLNELGRIISAELDQEKVVQAVTDAATSLSGAEFGAFFYNVLDDAGGSYMLYTLSGVPREAFASFPMPRNTSVFGPTFRGEGIVRSADITQDPRYGKNAPRHGMPEGHLPVRSYLAVPVRSRSGEILGGIFLGHATPGVFDAQAETLTAGLAAQAAVAIDNARLFERAQRLIGALEQTNAELDQFAYVASHDLKAPLRGIGSLAEWIEEDLGEALTEGPRTKMVLLRGRVRRMEALIQGILDYSRAGRTGGAREELDAGRLVTEIAELLAPVPPARIVVGEGLPVLNTERIALQQVLLNLVSNGLKHAGRPDAEIRVDAAQTDDGVWEFRVSDNGPGIAPEFHERIWGIFQTLEPRDRVEATGIGLAIVRKIVDGRGGRARIEANPTGGSSFFFTWPARGA